VIGRTDRHGGVPVGGAHTPADLAATVLHALGVPPDAAFRDPEGRPHRLTEGEVIRGLMG
jgi:hypothetical protein